MWTKRSDHAPKNGCEDFFLICPKKEFLGKKINVYLLPSFFLLSSYNNKFPPTIYDYSKGISLSWSPDFCNKRTSLTSLTAKPIG
jgi:hypothetical protein